MSSFLFIFNGKTNFYRDSLAPYYKYLDEMSPELVNLLVLNGYLSLVAILITIL